MKSGVRRTEYRVQSTGYRVQSTDDKIFLLSPLIHLCPLETGGPRNEVPEGVDKNEDEDEDERLKAAEQRLIATGSQVNVAEQRLKDTQSQGDDSPATPLRLTSSSAAINRSEAAPRSSAHL